jgi:hypothetical protein
MQYKNTNRKKNNNKTKKKTILIKDDLNLPEYYALVPTFPKGSVKYGNGQFEMQFVLNEP